MVKLTMHPTMVDEEIEVMDINEEVIATVRFRVAEIDDVRHMLISAINVAERHRMSEVRQVLVAQADAISKGLHIRDHDFPDLLGDVNAFHAKYGQEYLGKPRMLPEDLHDFRIKFHEEETHEYRDEYDPLTDAVERKDRRDILNSMELQLDALCDAVWVLLGTADLQFGRRVFFAAWRRVVTANMAKVRVEVKEDGTRNSEETGRAAKYDIGKPPGWTAPDHRDLVTDNAIFDEIFGVPEPETEFMGTNQ